MTDPREIAARLTDAQKRALRDLAAHTFTEWRDHLDHDAIHGLMDHRLATIYPTMAYNLISTPTLGRAVLAAMEKEPRNG